ncbi:Hypothetical Protein FCC1311_047932 [Hondaea fermentalgiana]|uniref:DUF1697 domain-containing protein n=1 Tax=Hondaea fermentalgiana TaxID=2315210 RepID=A0A2R5GJW6_9STRA|nr:Hypothetical Protein FCC1311_047932 [Hondaea fermentalgiana]|eukprot:GBG28571.1 Hypothetical Protein FCC1311_047932 [Hondaea fermentalgiana]
MPMAKLRDVLNKVPEFSKVSTLVQSGNIKLDAPATTSEAVQATLKDLIEEHFGYDVPVMVFTRDELCAINEANPYKEASSADHRKVHVGFFDECPDAERVTALQSQAPFPQNEEFTVLKNCMFLHTPLGYGRAKVNSNFLEKHLDIELTCRNMNTIAKLLS